MLIVVFLFISFIITRASTEVDPCDLNCDGEENTLCKYCPPGAASKCGKVINQYLTEEEKTAFLDVHNEYRRDVANGKVSKQPKAALMYKFVWSDNIAKAAKRWSEQCEANHDKCRRTKEFKAVGQNYVMMSGSGTADSKQLVKLWFDEVQYLTDNVYKPDSKTGHYTQLAWATTTHLGCARMVTSDPNGAKTEVYCNYGPAGNIVGEKYIYPDGEPCSQCKSPNTCENGLCLCKKGSECFVEEDPIDDSCGGGSSFHRLKWILFVFFLIGVIFIISGLYVMLSQLRSTKTE